MKNLTFEEQDQMGYKAYLNVMENGKGICRFYFNMKGYVQDFWLKNSEGVGMHFGERSKTQQISALKRAIKEGYTNIINFPK